MWYFIKGNVWIACFNLLPIYPLDGGKVLHALISYHAPFQKALLWTFTLGMLFSIALALFALGIGKNGFHIHLFAIAIYLLIHNAMALRQREWPYLRFLMERKLKGVPVSAKLQPNRIFEDVPIHLVVKQLYKERYHVWEVLDQKGRVVGLLPEEKLIQQYFRDRSKRTIAELMK